MSSVPNFMRKLLRAESVEQRCAYCHSPERLLGIPLEADHVIPETAGGKTDLGNLCLCCRSCNGHKWKRTHARDPQSGRRTRLFHPRRQLWTDHFTWSEDGLRIVGISAIGRATVDALEMNNDLVIKLRELWVVLGLHPRPTE